VTSSSKKFSVEMDDLVQAIEEAMKWVNPLPCPECGSEMFPAENDGEYSCASCSHNLTMPTLES
jgi:NADH pyrophosphatase NudC (nudix superfamily)